MPMLSMPNSKFNVGDKVMFSETLVQIDGINRLDVAQTHIVAEPACMVFIDTKYLEEYKEDDIYRDGHEYKASRRF